MEKRYHLAIWTTNPAADPAAKLLHTSDAWEVAKLRGMAAGAKPGQYVEIIDNQGSNGEAWTVPTADPQPATPATENATENAKEDQTMTTATKEAPARSYYADRIETANATREAVKTLESIYRETIEKTPAETIAAYVAAVGHDMAVCVLASLVNRSAWDGRISRRCAEWAKAQENAWDEEAAEKLWIGSDRIHRAHLNQLAAAMMEYQPEEPAEKTTEEPKEDQTMTIATKEAPARSYYADRIETAGRAFTCTYRTEENGDIIADLITDCAPLAVVIPQDHPDHPAALAAATSDELPAMIPADPDEIHPETVRERLEDSGIVGGEVVDADKLQAAPIVCAAMEQAEQIEQGEEAAPIVNPEPIREPAQIVKPWAGEQIQGNGWRIVFDTTTARTRVIFDVQPAEEVKKAVAAAGFYWSAVMQSWNKGLTCKARRKAQQLAETLAAMLPAAV